MKWQRANPDTVVADLTFTVEGLVEEVDFVFRVAAENKAGVGPYSPPSEPKKYGVYLLCIRHQLIGPVNWSLVSYFCFYTRQPISLGQFHRGGKKIKPSSEIKPSNGSKFKLLILFYS